MHFGLPKRFMRILTFTITLVKYQASSCAVDSNGLTERKQKDEFCFPQRTGHPEPTRYSPPFSPRKSLPAHQHPQMCGTAIKELRHNTGGAFFMYGGTLCLVLTEAPTSQIAVKKVAGQWPQQKKRTQGARAALHASHHDHVHSPVDKPPRKTTFGGADILLSPAKPSEGGKTRYDPLRDGPLRYLGYTNETGEAFAAFLPPWGVPASYGVAIAYVLCDTMDKGWRAWDEMGPNEDKEYTVEQSQLRWMIALNKAGDCLMWQMLASVILPGFTIHQIVHFSHALLVEAAALLAAAPEDTWQQAASSLLLMFEKPIPTAIGLLMIPQIIHPLDSLVHLLMDLTMRPKVRTLICERGASHPICQETYHETPKPLLTRVHAVLTLNGRMRWLAHPDEVLAKLSKGGKKEEEE
eukprot:jgi/Mesvir1/14520/Mv05217-RA.1